MPEKVSEWERDGHIEQVQDQLFCCSPLSLALKYHAMADKIMKIDLSRWVNTFIVDFPV